MSRRLIDAAQQVYARAYDAYNEADTDETTAAAELVMDLAGVVLRLAKEADQAEARADAAGLGQ